MQRERSLAGLNRRGSERRLTRSPPAVQQVEIDSGGGRHPAMTRRSGFFSIAAIHFHDRSEAVIDPRVLRFSAWPAGMQRLESCTALKARSVEGRLIE